MSLTVRNPDAIALAGIITVVVGIGIIWPPLALVVLGGMMVAVSALIAWVRASEKRGPKDDD